MICVGNNLRRVSAVPAVLAAGALIFCAFFLMRPLTAEAASVSDEDRMRGFATYVQEQDLAGGFVGFGDFSDIGEDGENVPNIVAGDSRMQGMLEQMRAMESEYGPLIQDKVTVISKRQEASGQVVKMEDLRMSEMSMLAEEAAALAIELEQPAAEQQPEVIGDPVVVQTPEEIIRMAEQQVMGGGISLLGKTDLELLRREVSGTLSGDTFPTTNWRRFGNDLISLGTFTLTAYDPCELCCGKTDGITATGTKGKTGRTIAVDPSVIPYGSRVLIGGYVFIAEDTGSAIRGRHIDMFMDTHEIAMQFGKREGEVLLIR